MRNKRLAISLLLAPLLLALTTTGSARASAMQEPPPATARTPTPAAAFDAYVADAVAEWGTTGLAVAVVRGGETVFAKGYGVRDLGTGAPVDAHTLFAIGSTTKAMTAAAIGMLVDEGALHWDSRVEELLPGFALADPWVSRELTVRDLLTHRAGLGNADLLWYRRGADPDWIVSQARLIPTAYSMRAGYVYQNIMYAAAGAVIETVSGRSWAEFVTERILEPLGMERTVALGRMTESMDNVASPHYRIDGEVRVIDNAWVDPVAAAGSVWSSVNDMAKWVAFMLSDGEVDGLRLLEPATHAELLTPQIVVPRASFYPTTAVTEPTWTTYALGWFQHDWGARDLSFHTGSIDGMVAIAALLPEEGLGVYVLANLDHSEVRHALMYEALERWGGFESGRDWSVELKELYDGIAAEQADRTRGFLERRTLDTEPSLPLEAFAGTYHDPLFGNVEIRLEQGGLQIVRGEVTGDLAHWHYDNFMARWHREWMGTTPVDFLPSHGRVNRFEAFGRTFRRVER